MNIVDGYETGERGGWGGGDTMNITDGYKTGVRRTKLSIADGYETGVGEKDSEHCR